jgi:hypothetical protein
VATGKTFPSFSYYRWISCAVHGWIGMTIWKASPEKIWTWSP